MVFGLPERKDEKLEERVQEVFQEIGLKPILQASRVGKINQGKSKRPVKVSQSSSSTVHQVLSKVMKHCNSATFNLEGKKRVTLFCCGYSFCAAFEWRFVYVFRSSKFLSF